MVRPDALVGNMESKVSCFTYNLVDLTLLFPKTRNNKQSNASGNYNRTLGENQQNNIILVQTVISTVITLISVHKSVIATQNAIFLVVWVIEKRHAGVRKRTPRRFS